MTDDELREKLRPFIEKQSKNKAAIDAFMQLVHYRSGENCCTFQAILFKLFMITICVLCSERLQLESYITSVVWCVRTVKCEQSDTHAL
jgi:hypothetical protein